MKIQTFEEAKQYLYTLIPRGVKLSFPGNVGLKRMKYFLRLLKNPQNKIKVIHVAGTSGKGSTSYMISILLKSLGFRVGLHVSPFLIDLRERFQINNSLIKESEFVDYLNRFIPLIEEVKKTQFGSLTYFEVLTALAYYIFWQQRVDYAVVETGMGGWYDATNSVMVSNKIGVLTRIGFDHTKILGNTLSKIALQKAMITQSRNDVFSIWQHRNARKVIEKVIAEKKGSLFYIKKNENFSKIRTSFGGTFFDFNFGHIYLKQIKVGLAGSYQAENSSLALATVIHLSKRDHFIFDTKKVINSLKGSHFSGRFDILQLSGKKLIIDGAHNPQKMSAFIKNLRELFPQSKFQFLIAFKRGKEYSEMLRSIIPIAKQIIVTSFFYDKEDLVHLSETPQTIASALHDLKYKNVKIIPEPISALHVLQHQEGNAVITGSLYLIGSIYKKIERMKTKT